MAIIRVQENKERIWIVSGGFHDFIDETLYQFDILPSHILANRFVYNQEDWVVGFDENNYLSQAGGKVKALKSLNLKNEVVVIGDGWTDYEIKERGQADYFYAFTENVKREKVTRVADKVLSSFSQFLLL